MYHIHKYRHTKYPTVMLYGIRFTGYHKVVAVHCQQFVVCHLKKKKLYQNKYCKLQYTHTHIILRCNKIEAYSTTFFLCLWFRAS
jgi:hypothetical protein